MRYPEQGGVCRPGGLELTRRLLEVARLPQGSRMLDVGCGSGTTLNLLRQQGYEARGIDACPQGAADADVGRAEALPYEDGMFSGLLMECCLSDFKEPEHALLEAARVLEAGGWLLVTDVYARGEEACCRFRLDCRERVEGRLKQAGFRLVCFEDCSWVLREFWAQLVWEHGRDALCGMGLDGTVLRRAKAGYYLAAARKEGQL